MQNPFSPFMPKMDLAKKSFSILFEVLTQTAIKNFFVATILTLVVPRVEDTENPQLSGTQHYFKAMDQEGLNTELDAGVYSYRRAVWI